MYNKRGLSDIVATLIIILLVIVAAGIIWVVVRNIVGSGADTISNSQKCIAIELQFKSLSYDSTGDTWDLKFQRRPGGEGTLSGVDVVLYGVDGGSISSLDEATPLDDLTDIEELETVSVSITGDNTAIDKTTGVIKVELFPYFINPDNGAKYICETPLEHNFQTAVVEITP